MPKINLLICAALFTALFGGQAFAESKPWIFGWPKNQVEWENYKKHNPYLETGKQTQNQQWNAEDWYVQDWLAQNSDNFKLIDGFFKNDILRKQTEDDGVAVLIVGPNFYRLGGFDKRRVITTVDAVYGITANESMIILRDWYTKQDIGLFTKEGLQLE